MSGDNSHNHQTTSVAGGTSATPTPANNVGGGTGWGDRLWMGGKEQGLGHVDAPTGRSTMGEFLGLKDQKSRAENKYFQRAEMAEGNDPMNTAGDPTCASEDHSFMGQKPGGSETLPGWNKMKEFAGG
ncbi:hypothetical protein N7541_009034 [Penicillium brevicompactum]|uniref:Uncharacterized protein n=1 Tax=Penicillium brevicompactum TaxID=5074 RepID=A0A9W9Q688_PENBR|nr:hypothetical protein N7452_008317 [Penicillium brevicompactum]KAJ5346552.1 hypothetical protein N7541_009034 [Penicillium brevicompactum]